MAKAVTQRKSAATLAKPQEPSSEQAGETASVATENAEGLRAALAPAYRNYLEARRTLALAFKDREYRDQEAYRDAERRYRVCAESIDGAMKAREKSELDASDEHRSNINKAVDRALQLYRDKTRQATFECRQTVMEAWKTSRESPDKTTAFCEEAIDKAMKAREKSELDALSAYRLEIDRAVDRAAQEYRDKLERAVADCRQRVSEAWRSSMESSAHMTGIFEEDRVAPVEESAGENRPPSFGLQVRAAARRAKTRITSAFRSAMTKTSFGRRRG